MGANNRSCSEKGTSATTLRDADPQNSPPLLPIFQPFPYKNPYTLPRLDLPISLDLLATALDTPTIDEFGSL